MAKDPAFLFYPGDYLKDTQCLSEPVQVAYDRIMCEHMRNICSDMSNIYVSQKQLDFFTKRLTNEQKDELFFVLEKVEHGYQIPWVAQSMAERKAYSESRAKNRKKGSEKKPSKPKKDMKTYVKHMEDENEIENEDINREEKESETEKSENEKIHFFIEPEGETYEQMTRGQKAKLHKQLEIASQIQLPYDNSQFRQSFYDFLEHKAKINAPYTTSKGMQKLFKMYEGLSEQEFIHAFDKAVASGTHQTIYPDTKNQGNEKRSNQQANEFLHTHDPNYQNY